MTEKVVINPKESALVVIDMQNDFCYEDGALFVGNAAKEIIPKIKEVIEKAREKKAPLIFTQDWHTPDDEEFEIWGKHCIQDTKGAEVINELYFKEGYIVKKQGYSAFFNTDLDSYLKEKGIRTLIMVGVVTNICVLHTAVDAAQRGYKIIIPRDCVTALNVHDQEYGLHHIEFILKGTITTSEAFGFTKKC